MNKDENEKQLRIFEDKFANHIVSTICVIFSLIFLYLANFGSTHALMQRSLLLTFTMFLIFLFYPIKKQDSKWSLYIDITLSLLGALAFLRVFLTADSLLARGGQPELLDLILGGVVIVLLIESIRRTIGWFLSLLIIFSIIYAFFGDYFPSLISHSGMSYERLIQVLYLTTEGIFTTPIAAVANFVLVYIILGTILQKSGTGKAFIDLALSLFGRFRGGPAKVSVISSSLFGSISGSTVSNVMATGTITIPLMKSNGFKSRVSGAIEACASTGGQIMPPVMGATAFIMAEIMGTSYLNIVISAILPAVLYYVSLISMVDLESAKMGLKGLPRKDLPNIRSILLERGHLFIPIIVLVILLGVVKFTPQKSAFWAILAAVIAPQLRRNTRVSPRILFQGLREGAINVLMVAVVCAGAGIIIGVLLYSGLALNLSSILISLAGDHLIILLILTAIVAIILGMGLPTAAAYILLAVLIAPALINMGLSTMTAHMFIFYFGCLSAITPPVAVAAYSGAALAKSDPMHTSITAFRFGIAGFIIPFLFAYAPELLLEGDIFGIIIRLFTAIIGVYGVAAVQQGYLLTKLTIVQRLQLLLGSILLIFPNIISEIVGVIFFLFVFYIQYMQSKKQIHMIQ